MPGRTPTEAVEAFLAPLRDAANVLDGYSKILLSQRGGYRKGETYSWSLCGPEGMRLTGLDARLVPPSSS